jgi:hypothetical protein
LFNNNASITESPFSLLSCNKIGHVIGLSSIHHAITKF